MHELIDEGVARFPHFLCRTFGHDDAVMDEVGIVRHLQRFRHVVGDDDGGDAERVIERADQMGDQVERDRVEAGERFVVHGQRRVEADRPREGDAAGHAA